MKAYIIESISSGEKKRVEAENLIDAMKQTGWPQDDCRVSLDFRKPEQVAKAEEKKKQKGPARKKRQETKPVEGVEEASELAAKAKASVEFAQKVEKDIEEAVEAAQRPKGEQLSNLVCGDCGYQPTQAELDEQGENLCPACGKPLVTKPSEQEISTTAVTTGVTAVVQPPSEAEQKALDNKKEIESLAVQAEVMFLEMGRRMYEAREKGEWTILRYESFKEYIEDLKLPMTNSYSWATRLTNIYEYMVIKGKLDLELLARIGAAKLTRLLPLARRGELTQEVIEAAMTLSDLDLRESLGQNVGGGGSAEDMIICPRCGQTFDAKKAARAEKH